MRQQAPWPFSCQRQSKHGDGVFFSVCLCSIVKVKQNLSRYLKAYANAPKLCAGVQLHDALERLSRDSYLDLEAVWPMPIQCMVCVV